jgi:LPS O-antigen subunit length determinant protein (WzzB/FepE family)
MSPSATNFFKDIVKGVSVGMMASDVNKPFQGMGAAISGAMSRVEQDEATKKASDADYQNWLRRYETTREGTREDIVEERSYGESQMKEQRKYAEEQAESAVDRAIRQLTESLEVQRRAKASERADLKSEMGKFNPLSIDNMLYEAVGQYAPRYTGSPRGSSVPTMAWGGGTIS